MEEDIQITNIEAELNRLWELHKVDNRVRACLFTLVIYAQTKNSTTALKDLMRLIVERYPCRIIFIQQDNALDNTLKVDVSNEIVGEKDGEVACDLILIKTAPSQIHRVPSIVLPHLVPDLPIYFLWGEDPTLDHAILPYLDTYSNRLIFNTDHSENYHGFSQKMLKLIQSHPHQDYIDMDWLLALPWRNALKHAFELKKAFEWLKISTQIQIHFNNLESQEKSPSETQAVYLISWLASLMNWDFIKKEKQNETIVLTFTAKQQECHIYLTPEIHKEYLPGTIMKMELSSSDEHYMSIVPLQDIPKAMVHISSVETCELPYTIPLNLKSSHLDIHRLLYNPMSSHYPLMLQKMNSIEW